MDLGALLDLGGLLSDYGFNHEARHCYLMASDREPSDLRAAINLARLETENGQHASARHRHTELLRHLPDHPVIRRNALTGLEYDPQVTDAERLHHNKKDTHFNCLNKQHSLNSCPWPAPVAPPSRWPTHLWKR